MLLTVHTALALALPLVSSIRPLIGGASNPRHSADFMRLIRARVDLV